ncbi:MAG TPA: CocE/NonD family hydrolase [Verrucomicrobiae bacterium]|nr:CocE/NonD family hydrolase [Verrucomicrobiae bacterium]
MTLAQADRRHEVEVPMRDGLMLAADIYLPDPDPGHPVPAIVFGTPYDKRGPGAVDEGRFFQARDYAYIAYDTRGRGKSEGEWRAHVNDGRDGHDVVEWVAGQPWCDGRVGTTGLSYGGWNQWATAREHPPHLVCMASFAAAGRWMQEIPYTFGVFQLYFAYWVYGTRRRIQNSRSDLDWERVLMQLPVAQMMESLGAAPGTWPDMRDHDTLDDFWRRLRLDDDYRTLTVPCLHVAGWHDREDLLGAFHHYESMIAASPRAADQWLIVGPWPHVGTRYPQASYGGVDFGDHAALAMDQLQLRFFDHWLKGQSNGWSDEPRVRLFETGSNRWLTPAAWPLAGERVPLHLRHGPEGTTLGRAGAAANEPPVAFRYDPNDPVRVPGGLSYEEFYEPSLDETHLDGRADVIRYTTPPLTTPLAISGWPRLELHASSDCEDTDWHVKLEDRQPDGRLIRVAAGCLRAVCRESLTHPTPLVPDVVTCFDVELNPVSHVFLPGHRLVLAVTSSDFPWFARNCNRAGRAVDQRDPRVAVNAIHHGPGQPSRLWLPVVSGSEGL